ncbi:aminotransferase class V-fold PLP-dependent enzyme [Brunnivagina elsteri]|uniref:Aminotransferase class V domain-containing protein n=1 Tax=Brunnivagina elsteri CCALA 953 TaxID=987040 RepID=A0A2A2TH12_9CYAN|nr:aminotransferase class V-fold PLP-dependent enzyme [Calothrix elsteri]PAX52918.1 hypothetical protein CK510_16675 [Calothrix elsteri CCALA 953]
MFTSGATESINLVIQGSNKIDNTSKIKPRIGVLPVEHKAVLDTCYALAKKGLAEIINLQVDSKGRLDINHLEEVCTSGLSLLFGGGHQKGQRSGTLNVPGIVGLGEACRLRLLEMEKDENAIALLRDKLQSLLLDKIPGLTVNGDINSRLSGNLHISIPDVPNSAIIARVRHQLAISTGAACSSGVETPSHVLTAMGLGGR